jgi:hypothetical protein
MNQIITSDVRAHLYQQAIYLVAETCVRGKVNAERLNGLNTPMGKFANKLFCNLLDAYVMRSSDEVRLAKAVEVSETFMALPLMSLHKLIGNYEVFIYRPGEKGFEQWLSCCGDGLTEQRFVTALRGLALLLKERLGSLTKPRSLDPNCACTQLRLGELYRLAEAAGYRMSIAPLSATLTKAEH